PSGIMEPRSASYPIRGMKAPKKRVTTTIAPITQPGCEATQRPTRFILQVLPDRRPGKCPAGQSSWCAHAKLYQPTQMVSTGETRKTQYLRAFRPLDHQEDPTLLGAFIHHP